MISKQMKYHLLHMDMARLVSRMSYDQRMQQGAVIVHDSGPMYTHNVVSYGWNGMPHGHTNDCQHQVDGKIITKKEVVHAEANAINKMDPHINPAHTTIYATMVPCLGCAQAIVDKGIRRVVYGLEYRSDEGLEYLLSKNIKVLSISQIYKAME